MRALQAESAERLPAVSGLRSYQRLRAITTSALYGHPTQGTTLLPAARDPLAEALLRCVPDWTVPRLVQTAQAVAVEWDNYSLTGLAARAGDPVVLTALRESVVLEAGRTMYDRPEYLWNVSPSLVTAARRFVTLFNELLQESLPDPEPYEAGSYWRAHAAAEIFGRCVCVGEQPGHRFYHWAIGEADGRLAVQAFWDGRVWATADYRAALDRGEGLPA